MSKFIYIYKGPATPMADYTEEQSAEQMAAWGAWMGKNQHALVNMGAPFAARVAVTGDGKVAEPSELHGYTVVEAEDLEAAKALTEGHPFLVGASGEFSVEIFELVDVQM